MNKNQVIRLTEQYVQEELKNAEGGHDWWHIHRVRNNAKMIAKSEHADMLVVELGALLHDIADSKFHKGDEDIGPRKARVFLDSLGVEISIIDHIEMIVRNVSFRDSNRILPYYSKELEVIQDADRLDAIGAIGTARLFNFGGYKGREIHNPNIKPNLNMTKEEYKMSAEPPNTTLNHFYEKLLLLKDLMNTETGKIVAESRHQFMVSYLEQFYKEWDGLC